MQKIWSVVDLLRRNPHWWSPIISSTYGLICHINVYKIALQLLLYPRNKYLYKIKLIASTPRSEWPLCWYYRGRGIRVCEICCWKCLMWHDLHSKFSDNRFRHTSNTNVITSTIWEASVLVLMSARIYEIRRWGGPRWHNMHTKFHFDRLRHSSNMDVIT
jgi:hypothetical protein